MTYQLWRRSAMSLDDLIIAWFCVIDDLLPKVTEGKRLRQRGPAPKLADSEVLTMEVVGTYLGLSQDKALFTYFRRHWTAFFPALAHLHRTTFVRQAANLWAVKERLWCAVRDDLVPYDPTVAIVDSFPVPACQFARAYRCRRFRGEARYGKDHTARQMFYGFRLHARVCWPGVMTQMQLAPANLHEALQLHFQADQEEETRLHASCLWWTRSPGRTEGMAGFMRWDSYTLSTASLLRKADDLTPGQPRSHRTGSALE
jgi:hypothetical protein